MRPTNRFQRSINASRLRPRISSSGIELDLPGWTLDRSGRLLSRGANRLARRHAGYDAFHDWSPADPEPDACPESTSLSWYDESGCGVGGGIFYISPDILLA